MRGTPSGYWNSDRRIFNYYYELTVIFIIIKEKSNIVSIFQANA